MTSDMTEDARARNRTSESNSSQARQSDTPRSLFDHDSSNFLLSPALSVTTVNSRPVSTISCLPSPTFRDSVISIVNDPFFQKLRDVGAHSSSHLDDSEDDSNANDSVEEREEEKEKAKWERQRRRGETATPQKREPFSDVDLAEHSAADLADSDDEAPLDSWNQHLGQQQQHLYHHHRRQAQTQTQTQTPTQIQNQRRPSPHTQHGTPHGTLVHGVSTSNRGEIRSPVRNANSILDELNLALDHHIDDDDDDELFADHVDERVDDKPDPLVARRPSPSHSALPAQAGSAASSNALHRNCSPISNANALNQPYKRPQPKRESLTIGHFQPTNITSPSPSTSHSGTPTMESLNIAIIGARGVGKSSFVQRVLGLSRPPISNSSSLRMVIDNQNYAITLLELDLEHFDMAPSQPIQWPKQINGHILPRVDGALILYDVTNKETIMDLPRTLAALTNSGLPSILVACKCDASENARQVDADGMANHDLFKACVANYNISSNKPEHSRACFNTILRTVIANRKGAIGEAGASRRRAASVAQLDTPTDPNNGRPLSQQSKHSRASSDLSLLRGGFPNPPISGEQYRSAHHQASSRSPRLDYNPATSSANAFSGEPVDAASQSVSSQLRTPGIRLDLATPNTFLDMDESDGESYRYSDDIPILQRNDDTLQEKPAKAAGVSFDELVDRLVAQRMTKADHSFADIFLCLYRQFAPPLQLFSAILDRLDRVRDDHSSHYLTKTATQLRMIEVVAKWVSLYPGDFARPVTKRSLQEFVRHLSTEPIFFTSAQQIRRYLEYNVVEDDDTWWAKSDPAEDPKRAAGGNNSAKQDNFSGISSLRLDDDPADVDRRSSGPLGGFSADGAVSNYAGQSQIQQYEEYERQAMRLEPTGHLPMIKARYHSFMAIPDEEVAEEMTRIDWIMFSSIRIRDFVRHVALSAEEKEKCRSLKNVNRMINHFNHVAKWVANMVLLRDKPKHRAQMLEKFMNVAMRLRQLNNYNGLAAVLAGINGTAVHRLAQTRALVPADVQKNFARLVILMGTQKSHFAYRLAWENSPLPRIPFVPLHRRDLVSAEEGSKTFVGPNNDRINWKKFEVLGEVILPIMKSQGTAYGKLGKHDSARELILDCRMPTDEEEIYERSIEVEPPTGGPSETGKKKFPWFAKS
ncbi:hypothetical protein jhhlp_004374 [Lomentospora prolificans]|uniref:Ras-GEF domain-containing protein n=1 Tax=Lomentospora prolificans TaxID=41688 RepID=A0A2N3NBE8_9PEZI|nr:hypothetical protein jhhlp_004374 [Lomentospora prolificans]